MAEIEIREEQPVDIAQIGEVNRLAFGRAAEALLVDLLRDRGKVLLSLVAERGGRVVGHILFSPVTIESESATIDAVGLGPLAVLPEMQREGIGSALVLTGLEECDRRGHTSVVVLGHPDYYPRFGFSPASRHGIKCEYNVPDEVFMAIELRPGSLSGVSGVVKYQPEFNEV